MRTLITALAICASPAFADTSRIDMSGGYLMNSGVTSSREVYLRMTAPSDTAVATAFGISATDTGDYWAGVGWVVTTPTDQGGVYGQFSFMAGLWHQGLGPHLDHLIEFRTGVEIGYEFNTGIRLGLSLDHRSNAGLGPVNLGVETVQIRLSVPVN